MAGRYLDTDTANPRNHTEVNQPMTTEGITGISATVDVASAGVWAKAYTAAGLLLTALLVAQFFLAGLGIFTIVNGVDAGESPASAVGHSGFWWGLHAMSGLLILAVLLALVGLSFVSQKPWRTTGLTVGLLPLVILQAILAHTPFPQLSAVHVLNAVLIVAVAVHLVRVNWAFAAKRVTP